MTPTRVSSTDVNAVLKEFRRSSCTDVGRAIAVALVQARQEIAQLRAAAASPTTDEAL